MDGATPKRAVIFQYASESDGVNHSTGASFPFYPIPNEAITLPHWVEGGDQGNVDLLPSSDRHLLLVDRDNRHLYELFNVFYDGAQWRAGSGAFFDLNANGRRPEGWTSADAAGLAILPGPRPVGLCAGNSEDLPAMQRYGLIVADNDSDMYITGTYDTRWNNSILTPAFRALTANDFDVVQLGYNPAGTAPPPTNLRIVVN